MIRSYRRFAARRGFPKMLFSDNARTFKAANKELTELFKLPEVQEFLLNKRVQWRFNLERASWWGGVFERLIQSTKRCLKKVIGQAKLNYDELQTLVIEVEGVLNSKPLTYVYVDIKQALAPGHLLSGRKIVSLPDISEFNSEEIEEISSHELLTKRSLYLSALMKHFWKRWLREYLVDLREHHRIQTASKSGLKQIKTGGIVTVYDEGLKKGFWRLGKVESLIAGRDNVIRGAMVKVSSKGKKPIRIKRALQPLYPLEVAASTVTEGRCEVSDQNIKPEGPKRNAEVIGELRRKSMSEEFDQLELAQYIVFYIYRIC